MYDNTVIPLISPVLSCYFTESVKADNFYAKARLYDININFQDSNIRRELLSDGIAEHKIKIFEGPLPTHLVIGLMEPSVFDGDVKKSCFKFSMHNLESADLQCDNVSIFGFPICMKSTSALDFYVNYLRVTGRFENVFSSGGLTYNNFVHSNFLIYVDLKSENITSGQLILKLKFKGLLTEKIYAIFMPSFEKSISFDQYFNASLNALT